MGLEGMISDLLRISGVVKDTAAFVGTIGILAGIVLTAYAGASINRENIRQAVIIEGGSQLVEYSARTPRRGIVSLLPWNDDNGHAIINYGNTMAVDEDYNGSLFDSGDVIAIKAGGKAVKCLLDKAVNAGGDDVLFTGSSDPIVNAMITGAKNYCESQRVSADTIYQQAIKQLQR